MFTLTDLDVAYPAYQHFRECLDQIEDLSDEVQFKVSLVDDIPQCFQYKRTKELVKKIILSSDIFWVWQSILLNKESLFEKRSYCQDCFIAKKKNPFVYTSLCWSGYLNLLEDELSNWINTIPIVLCRGLFNVKFKGLIEKSIILWLILLYKKLHVMKNTKQGHTRIRASNYNIFLCFSFVVLVIINLFFNFLTGTLESYCPKKAREIIMIRCRWKEEIIVVWSWK